MKPEYAVTKQWELRCIDGHVLAMSDSQDDYPAAPSFDWLAPILDVSTDG